MSFTELGCLIGLLLDTKCMSHKRCYVLAELYLKTIPFEHSYL